MQENSPLESREYDGRDHDPANFPEAVVEVTIEHGQRDKTPEPENRRYEIEAFTIRGIQYPLILGVAQFECFVGEGGEDGPDGGEEEEICCVEVEFVDDWGNGFVVSLRVFGGQEGEEGERTAGSEADEDDGKKELDDADDEDDG